MIVSRVQFPNDWDMGWDKISRYVKVYFARQDCVVRWPDVTSMCPINS